MHAIDEVVDAFQDIRGAVSCNFEAQIPVAEVVAQCRDQLDFPCWLVKRLRRFAFHQR